MTTRQDALAGLVADARCVLFGFDGPICRAVDPAWPTPYADPLIRTWTAVGAHLGVVTDNSAEAARRYLEGRGLSACFGPRVYGRLDRAMAGTGATPGHTLMIGATVAELVAAREAGVAFVGYARDPDRERVLREAGAEQVIDSLKPIIDILRGLT
ncbi:MULTISPECIES: HAD family hydrolase [unclassified Streptomyces]|uniref:HAD family hydrolase n=1 Tax=unclassified Streptomyces TaxID=2593676 RepID=UPI00278C3B22|nr:MULTISPECIES: hypothetical protein [unclassified Streptomyces]